MKIVLLGYMASGKSTIGKQLSKNLCLPFIDLDAYIELKEKCTITSIFKKKGEIYFRRVEHTYLKELLNTEEDFILSLGGGTPCYANNMEFILKTPNTTSIYLQASNNLLIERLRKEKESRPLINELSDEKLIEFVAKHLFERRFFYEQANEKITIDLKEINDIVIEISDQLH